MDKFSAHRREALSRLLFDRFGGSQADLARAIARSPSAVWRLLTKGEHAKPIGESLARDIELRLGLSEYWLDGVAHALRPGAAGQDVYSPATSQTPRAVALYQEADAAVRASKGPGAVRQIGVLFASTGSEGSWALVVASDAMSPIIVAGDRVVIDPSVTPVPGDVVLALVDRRQALLRRIRSPSSQLIQYDLVPANSDYPTVTSPGASVEIVGTMIEHHRIRPTR